jgi:hypothetical protein
MAMDPIAAGVAAGLSPDPAFVRRPGSLPS